jgi:hypothetical protein
MQQRRDVFEVSFSRSRSNRKVRSSNEREEHYEAEKGKGEEQVYAQSGYEKYEARDDPITWLEIVTEVFCISRAKTLTLRRCGILAMHCKLHHGLLQLL